MASYSVQIESLNLLKNGILSNPLFFNLPPELHGLADDIKFTGSTSPSIPINWRIAEATSALTALEALLLKAILKRKYKVEDVNVEINTDYASLFVMGLQLMDVVDISGNPVGGETKAKRLGTVFPSRDYGRARATPHRAAATNLYKTKDGRFYDVHGSMNPDITIRALGLPIDREAVDYEDAVSPYTNAVKTFDSQELDHLMNDIHRQAGTICYSTEEFAKSEQAKANSHVGLYEIEHINIPEQSPTWWPSSTQTTPRRPLAGLKIVDLTRIIAGPSISRGLAELGASVMRVTGPKVPDMAVLHIELNWGKWNTEIDLKTSKGKESLRKLILDADVVLDGYRPGVMEKLGFGREDILSLCKDRDRGIIYARENCYGWHGPWKGRSGWQQISDACCGVSMAFGRAMGNDEPVTQYFPTSDYCTGLSGIAGILHAIIQRGEKGGSFVVQTALNYFSQWFVKSCGVYPPDVWEKLWSHHGNPVIRHWQTAGYALPDIMKRLFENSQEALFKPEFFEIRRSEAVDKFFKRVKPVIHFPGAEVELTFNVGTRSNGTDKAEWPEDLMCEVVV